MDRRPCDRRVPVDTWIMPDVVMIQLWLFGLELSAGGSLAALCALLDAEWPAGYRPHATA
jgi:hypothetical protein